VPKCRAGEKLASVVTHAGKAALHVFGKRREDPRIADELKAGTLS